MLKAKIESVHVQGFRSLADFRFAGIPDATVLIGANGCGKSNLFRFFEMMSWMLGPQQLEEYIARQGGADAQLHFGYKSTPELSATVKMKTEAGSNEYKFRFVRAHPDRFFFADEAFRFSRSDLGGEAPWQHLGIGHREAKLVEAADTAGPFVVDGREANKRTAKTVRHLLRNCQLYQFHDTSDSSRFKTSQRITDNFYFRGDGGNLAAVLFRLEREEDPRRYRNICRYISRILPIFDRFVLREVHGSIMLRWKAKGEDKILDAHLTSDGSLRFFALVTLLNLPPEMLPEVLMIDEPELGLHPEAVEMVGAMLKTLAKKKQVIVATQSPLLADAFTMDNIVVLDAKEGKTRRLELTPEQYQAWLDDYSTGEIWRKNLIGGNP